MPLNSRIPLIWKVAIWCVSRCRKSSDLQLFIRTSKYFSRVFIEEFSDGAGPPSQRGHVLRSDKRSYLGMQMLNELTKIKNGRGERLRLISKTFLPSNDPANVAHSYVIHHCPRGDLIVSSRRGDLLRRTLAIHEVKSILRPSSRRMGRNGSHLRLSSSTVAIKDSS